MDSKLPSRSARCTRLAFVGALLALFALLVGLACPACKTPEPPYGTLIRISSDGVSALQIGVSGARPKIPASLRAIAHAKGSVRVIVELGLNAPYRPDLAGTAALDQDKWMQRSRDSLLVDLGLTPAMVTVFPRVPFIAFEATENQLLTMDNASTVVSVRRDLPFQSTACAAPAPSAALGTANVLVGATAAWANGWKGNGWNVVVIDTGVDDRHSFMIGKVLGGSAIYGAGAHYEAPGPPSAGWPVVQSPECSPNHGTAMGCIACGQTAYGQGVAPGAQVISIRVSDDTFTIWSSDVAYALLQVWFRWSVDHPVAAVCMSLAANPDPDTVTGGACADVSPLLSLAVELLAMVDIPLITGTGNDWVKNDVTYPACLASTLAVGATTKLDVVEGYSNSSAALDLLAPGSEIQIPLGLALCELRKGTSNAVPFVGGAFAIMRQRWPARPLPDLVQALLASPVKLTDAANGIVTPRLQIDAALQWLDEHPPTAEL